MNKADQILERLDRIIALLTPGDAAQIAVPARCEGFPPEQCALQSDDARISKASFGDPLAWACRGCRIQYRSVA